MSTARIGGQLMGVKKELTLAELLAKAGDLQKKTEKLIQQSQKLQEQIYRTLEAQKNKAPSRRKPS
jgi:hypothetical protein